MRIVIDLQGAQSSGSRNRGIGRYSLSLAKALIANKGEHEIIIALNVLFPEATDEIYTELSTLLPPENIVIWHVPEAIRYIAKNSASRRDIAENIREAFFASLRPDMVLVMSLFEGFGDDSVTSISSFSNTPTAVILYDFIPLIYKDLYLENPDLKAWYFEKIKSLKQADLLLSISESAKNEAHKYLNTPTDKVVNISTAADAHFYPHDIESSQEVKIREKYSLSKSFVMYTGGMDFRKNIEGLIRAYALLPEHLRNSHQLAIVCSITEENKTRLRAFAENEHLHKDEVIFTGFVTDEDLVSLYNLCEVFIFPSWHEGFGLPALEAMHCGCAVIGSNTSSLPEVIGLEEALFDPRDDHSISAKLEQALTDDIFRERLKKHGIKQAKKFSWDTSAIAAITAMEDKINTVKNAHIVEAFPSKKPYLAYLSPLPSERSGISDYSAELLPALSQHYQIDIITDQSNITDNFIQQNCTIRSLDWFRKNSACYDRILYHFGNSHFHEHMFSLLEEIPGVVVLHDFFLSGVTAYMEYSGYKPMFWTYNLYKSHGYAALKDHFSTEILDDTIGKYPANLTVLQNALGMIVHSENSMRLEEQWYGKIIVPWSVIPLLRVPGSEYSQVEAIEALGLPKDAFVICSFGLLHQNKLNHRLLQAFLDSALSKNKECHLVFVGESKGIEYANDLRDMFEESDAKNRIHITDWTEAELFKRYLHAADIGVQLRTNSRGESSAAVLDCMNYGLATIVNANGAMADLPQEALVMLPDNFSDSELIEALESLHEDKSRRVMLGQKAKEIIQNQHDPIFCAKQYVQSIENFYKDASDKLYGLMRTLPKKIESWSKDELISLSQDIAYNFPPEPRNKQLLLDISMIVNHSAGDKTRKRFLLFMQNLLENPPSGYRVEPVYLSEDRSHYLYARVFTSKFLNMPENILHDEAIDSYRGDIFIGSDINDSRSSDISLLLKQMKHRAVTITYIIYNTIPLLNVKERDAAERSSYIESLKFIAALDRFMTLSRAESEEIKKRISDEQLEVNCKIDRENEKSSVFESILNYGQYFD